MLLQKIFKPIADQQNMHFWKQMEQKSARGVKKKFSVQYLQALICRSRYHMFNEQKRTLWENEGMAKEIVHLLY